MSKILLNDILKIDDLTNVRIRFVLQVGGNWKPIEEFKNGKTSDLLEGQYWNYHKKKSFRLHQQTLGFIPLDRDENTWLLFHAGKVTKDLNIHDGVGYEYENIKSLSKYCGRLIIRFKNTVQTKI